MEERQTFDKFPNWISNKMQQDLSEAFRYKANVASNAGAGAVVSKFERDVLYPMKHRP